MTKLYIASPFGFSEAWRFFYEEKLLLNIRQAGFEVLDPWNLTSPEVIASASSLPYGEERRNQWQVVDMVVGANNVEAIRDCDGLVAVLDGVDVDSGTACEIGMAFALGKRIVGYRGDFRLAADNEGCVVNLQVEYAIRKSGGSIVTEIDKLVPELARLFPSFKP